MVDVKVVPISIHEKIQSASTFSATAADGDKYAPASFGVTDLPDIRYEDIQNNETSTQLIISVHS